MRGVKALAGALQAPAGNAAAQAGDASLLGNAAAQAGNAAATIESHRKQHSAVRLYDPLWPIYQVQHNADTPT